MKQRSWFAWFLPAAASLVVCCSASAQAAVSEAMLAAEAQSAAAPVPVLVERIRVAFRALRALPEVLDAPFAVRAGGLDRLTLDDFSVHAPPGWLKAAPALCARGGQFTATIDGVVATPGQAFPTLGMDPDSYAWAVHFGPVSCQTSVSVIGGWVGATVLRNWTEDPSGIRLAEFVTLDMQGLSLSSDKAGGEWIAAGAGSRSVNRSLGFPSTGVRRAAWMEYSGRKGLRLLDASTGRSATVFDSASVARALTRVDPTPFATPYTTTERLTIGNAFPSTMLVDGLRFTFEGEYTRLVYDDGAAKTTIGYTVKRDAAELARILPRSGALWIVVNGVYYPVDEPVAPQ